MQTIELVLAPELAVLAVGKFRTRPLLPGGERRIERRLSEPTTWTDAIEAVGVPHCEIGALASEPGGTALAPGSATRDGERVRVAGAGQCELDPAKLICDSHLGKLARTLRILGLDTLWQPAWDVDELVERALREERVVLSRGRALLKRREMDRAQLIRANDPYTQAAEVLARWKPSGPVARFGRCSVCNGRLRAVDRTDIEERIPPRTALWLDDYYLCERCDRLYWHGTHFLALRRRLAPLLTGPVPETQDPTEAP